MKKTILAVSLVLAIMLGMVTPALGATVSPADYQVSPADVDVQRNAVTTGTAKLREGPGTDYEDFATISSGVTLYVYKRTDNKDSTGYYWYLVKITDSSNAWYNYLAWIWGGNVSFT